MKKKDYRLTVKSFTLEISSYGYDGKVDIRKDSDGLFNVFYYSHSRWPDDDSFNPTLAEEESGRFFDRLFNELDVMHYRSDFGSNEGVLDGTNWSMRIEFTDRRAKCSKGYMIFPENWDELIELIKTICPDF